MVMIRLQYHCSKQLTTAARIGCLMRSDTTRGLRIPARHRMAGASAGAVKHSLEAYSCNCMLQLSCKLRRRCSPVIPSTPLHTGAEPKCHRVILSHNPDISYYNPNIPILQPKYPDRHAILPLLHLSDPHSCITDVYRKQGTHTQNTHTLQL